MKSGDKLGAITALSSDVRSLCEEETSMYKKKLPDYWKKETCLAFCPLCLCVVISGILVPRQNVRRHNVPGENIRRDKRPADETSHGTKRPET